MKIQRLRIPLILIWLWLLNSAQPPTAYMAETHMPTNTVSSEHTQPKLANLLGGSSPSDRVRIQNDVASHGVKPAVIDPCASRGWPETIYGDIAIVGAPDNDSAYVYYRNQGGANAWGVVKSLSGPGGSAFGQSVSLSGDIAVVEAPGSSRAFVFYRNRGGINNWGQVREIRGPDNSAFGCAASISGDTLVIGAWRTVINGKLYQGAAYVFQRNQGGVDNWGQVKQIVAADGAADDEFGHNVAVSGDVVVVGAHDVTVNGKINQGAAYVFYRNQGGANQWGQVKKIVTADGVAHDFFSISGVSVNGGTIVVGAPFANVGGNAAQGAAYVFYQDQGGANNWGQVKKIVATDGAAEDYFGDVSIYQDTIAVGAIYADIGGNSGQGATYIFYRDQGGADNWGQVRELTAFDGRAWYAFGRPQVNGNTLVVGTPFGTPAYVFDRDQGGANHWGLVKKLLKPDLTPPTNPTYLDSPSHGVNAWSNDNTVDVTWSGASDYDSGLDGYSVLWDNAASTIPDAIKDIGNISSLTSPPIASGSWYFHIRAVDNAGNWATGAAHLGPFKIDILPPTSAAFTPEFATAPFEVRWGGTDTGSGIASYDIWVRDGLAGTWTPWLAGTSAMSATYTDITAGHAYYFRSQARDVAGNLEADLPPDGDTHTTVAAYQVTGQVLTNRHQPIFNAIVMVDPPALNMAQADGRGHYTAYFAVSGTYSLTAARDGFGSLPPQMNLSFSGNTTASDFVLPPLKDAVTNGGFESGDLSGWTSDPILTATVEMSAAHTGGYGLRLESSGSGGLDFEPTMTQSVAISSVWSRPTLSWLYRVTQANPGDAFVVVASSESTMLTTTLPITIGEWLHDWVDLSVFSGQTVTLRFGFQTQALGQELALDEVSVGESVVGVYNIYLPLVMRSP